MRTNGQAIGATVYVRFDSQQSVIQDVFNKGKSSFPSDLVTLVAQANNYKRLVSFDFRYTASLELFEVMGVLSDFEDVIDVFSLLNEELQSLGYKFFISVGFGEIIVPSVKTEPLHVVTGDGVYSAFSIFKNKHMLQTKNPYFFNSNRFNCAFLNTSDFSCPTEKLYLKERLVTTQEKAKRSPSPIRNAKVKKEILYCDDSWFE